MSLGEALTSAISGNPMAQLNQALNPSMPGPVPGQGGPSAPPMTGGQPGAPQQPPMAPPQATQSPPDLANLYMRLYQQERGAQMFDQGLSGFQAAFAPPGQQAAWLAHGQQGGRQDPGQMLQNLMQLQYMQQLQNAPVPTEGGTAGGGQPGQSGGSTGQPIMDPSQWRIMTPQQKQEVLTRMAESHIQTSEALTKEVGQNKLDAIETYPTLDTQYKTAEDTVTWLNKHPDAVVKAVQMGPSLAGGRIGETLGGVGFISSDVRDARAKLDQLNDENFRAGLANVKNVRSQTEAIKVGGAVSSIDKPANSPEAIKAELTRLNDVVLGARANLMASAGKEIPYRYKDLVDPSYIDRNSPIYNGAKVEQPDTTIKSPGDVAKLPSGRAFVIPDGSGQIGYAP